MSDDYEAVMRASPVRRGFAVGVLGLLALLLIWMALATPAAPAWKAVLFVSGVASGWFAWWLWQASSMDLILDAQALRDSSGTVLARVAEIESVDRGVFAFKPSNGFLLRLSAPQPRAWRPGLWWRFGRRVGVGGVTAPAAAKALAGEIERRLAARTGQAQQ